MLNQYRAQESNVFWFKFILLQTDWRMIATNYSSLFLKSTWFAWPKQRARKLMHIHRKMWNLKKKKNRIRKQMNIMTFLTLNHMLPAKCLSLKNCTNEAIWRLLWTTASSLKIKWMMLMWLILVQGVMQQPENTLVIFIIKLNQHFKEMPVLSLVY